MRSTSSRFARTGVWLLALVAAAAGIYLALPYATANGLNLRAMHAQFADADDERTPASAPHSASARAAPPATAAQIRLALATGAVEQAIFWAAGAHPLRCDLAIRLGDAAFALGQPQAMDFWDDCPQIAEYLLRKGDDALAAEGSAAADRWYARAAALPAGEFDTSLALLKRGQLLQQESWEAALPVFETYRTLVSAGTLPEMQFGQRSRREVSLWQLIEAGHELRALDGDCSRARFWYALADRLNPGSEHAALYLGVCAATTEEKLAWFAQAIARNPLSDRGYYWTLLTWQRAGDCASAVEWYRQVAQSAPASVDVQLQLARCHEDLGETAAALDIYRALLTQDPGLAAAQQAVQRLSAEVESHP